MAKVMLGVRGMENDEQVQKVQTTLNELEGVLKAEARKDQLAIVEYDEGLVTTMDLIRALRRIGFVAGMQ